MTGNISDKAKVKGMSGLIKGGVFYWCTNITNIFSNLNWTVLGKGSIPQNLWIHST